jgi:hypothetical protein
VSELSLLSGFNHLPWVNFGDNLEERLNKCAVAGYAEALAGWSTINFYNLGFL